jgi:hypothetical protein
MLSPLSNKHKIANSRSIGNNNSRYEKSRSHCPGCHRQNEEVLSINIARIIVAQSGRTPVCSFSLFAQSSMTQTTSSKPMVRIGPDFIDGFGQWWGLWYRNIAADSSKFGVVCVCPRYKGSIKISRHAKPIC